MIGQTYVVHIDLTRLCDARERDERREVSAAEVRRWLIAEGVYPWNEGQYVCGESALKSVADEAVVRRLPLTPQAQRS